MPIRQPRALVITLPLEIARAAFFADAETMPAIICAIIERRAPRRD